MAKRYRKRPIIIEAMQWTGANSDAVVAFVGTVERPDSEWLGKDGFVASASDHSACLYVAANNGWLDVDQGEWVAKDSEGYYPIKEPVFARTYEELNDDDVPVGDLKMSP